MTLPKISAGVIVMMCRAFCTAIKANVKKLSVGIVSSLYILEQIGK